MAEGLPIELDFWREAPRATAGPGLVEPESAPAIMKVLAPEGTEGQGMSMTDDGLRRISHGIPTIQPAITEVPIF